jgi:MFS family permease
VKRRIYLYLVLLVVCYGVFVAADDLTVVSTVLTSILFDLEIPVTELDQAAWIVTSYLLGYVVTMPLLGRFSDLFGRRRVYILSMGFFILGSFFCAQAQAFAPLIGARVVTAFGGGAVVPIAMAVVGDLFPPKRRAFALGTIGAVDTLGWVFGPLYGAWMTERFDGIVSGWLDALNLGWSIPDQGWRWLFWINLPLGALAILSALAAIPAGRAEEDGLSPDFQPSPGNRQARNIQAGEQQPEGKGIGKRWTDLLSLLRQAGPFPFLAGGTLGISLTLLLALGTPTSRAFAWPLGAIALAVLVIGGILSWRAVDYAGAATLTIALVALNAALSGPGEGDWLQLAQAGIRRVFSPYLWPLLGVTVVALVAFILVERRTEFPFMDLSLFRIKAFTSANIANLLIGAGLIIAMVDVPLFVVAVQEGSPVETGLAIAPFTGAIVVAALIGGFLTEKLGYRLPGVAGLLISALGFGLMSQWNPEVARSTMRWHLAICGTGFGLVFSPIGTAVVNAVPKIHTGIASALVIILRLVGMSVGLSSLTAWGLYRLTILMEGAPDPLAESLAYWEHITQATSTIVGEIFAASALLCLLAVVPMVLLGRPKELERTVHGMR